MQRSDFEGILEAMQGYPVTIRLLDPPLHEFLPHEEDAKKEMADMLGITVEQINEKIEHLSEINPMLGHRGCRLGNTYPEITQMQARAILEATLNLKAKDIDARPEIMIPLTGTVNEFKLQADIVKEEVKKVFIERNEHAEYRLGTMIEVPRAALVADEIAKYAEFFSFGTNDLTQMTFGYSRDDAAKFLPVYLEKGILKDDPFQVLDTEGVGQLIKMAIEKGRSINPDLTIGVCGEHGGEPRSVEFCYKNGMNYVSCSPYRVPIAKVAAAKADIQFLRKM
jgi:pyruvate,orthophosphate dikinase